MKVDTSHVLERARLLESEIQRTAFDLLQTEDDYEKSQQLLLVASDVRKLTSRLEEVLSGKLKTTTAVARGANDEARGSRPRRGGGSKYPTFFVADGRLVKIGKGKQKTAKEYRHEAPRSAFEAVARWIEASSLAGAREWMARTADDQLSDQVPTYQVYLTIAALHKVGVLRSVRRGWYTLADEVGGPEGWWRRLAGAGLDDETSGED